MKRYEHYWFPQKGQRQPSRVAVLCCESEAVPLATAGRAKLEVLTQWHLAWVQISGQGPKVHRERSGHREEELWEAIGGMLASKDRTWLFLCPAGLTLSLAGFWRRLETGNVLLCGRDWRTQKPSGGSGEDRSDSLIVIEDPPTLIPCVVKDRPGRLTILDVRNWGIEPLGRGLAANERTERYLGGICDCMHTLRAGRLGTVRGTAASQAVQTLRTCWPVVSMHCHTDRHALQLERSAVLGGRCECYRIGDIPGPVYHLDVRSMYPSICLDLPLPVSLRRISHDAEGIARVRDSGGTSAIADVSIRTALPTYPLRRGGYTVYPVGEFRTALCGPELSRAISEGVIAGWHSALEYTCRPVLAGFYRQWLSLLDAARLAGRTAEGQWIKRVMTGLVGKFAEPGRRWVASPQRTDHEDNGKWYEPDEHGELVRYRNVCGYTQREEINGESYWSIPAITGFVMSAGRTHLWDYLATAGRRNVWYCDTDSLICNREAYDNLLHAGHIRDGETGYLRIVGQHHSCIVYGYRHYVLDGKVSCAGIPRGDIESSETREAYWHRERIAREIDLGMRPRSIARLHAYPPPERYHHGVVRPDGTVTPLEVHDG